MEDRYVRLVEGRSAGVLASAARGLLRAATPAWRLGLAIDQQRKRRGRRPLGRPTASIGNLSVGGTGKTPAVAWAVRRLLDAGHRPAVLTRGHGGDAQRPADEVLELRGMLRDAAPVIADPDRHAAAAAALAASPGLTCFVLDDGFQRLDVARDLDLVLVDASRTLASARLLPGGLLREPPAALTRADAVLLTRVDRAGPAATGETAAWVTRWHGRPPLASFAHRWSGVDAYPPAGAAPAIAGRRLYAAAGIGHPRAFAEQLAAAGAEVVGAARLADHHRPTAGGLARLHADARAAGADAVATTEKDRVKWAMLDPGPDALPVLVPRLRFEPVAGEAALLALLRERLPRPVDRPA